MDMVKTLIKHRLFVLSVSPSVRVNNRRFHLQDRNKSSRKGVSFFLLRWGEWADSPSLAEPLQAAPRRVPPLLNIGCLFWARYRLLSLEVSRNMAQIRLETHIDLPLLVARRSSLLQPRHWLKKLRHARWISTTRSKVESPLLYIFVKNWYSSFCAINLQERIWCCGFWISKELKIIVFCAFTS